ncbi:MAG: helix-turn-helix transcriptional regulator [Atopobiaceae bacterium]|nr:helix-turn-helix transcriptional regulator [Atopobiaceae bacterium]
MVKFVTTEYTHMYGNSHTGRSTYGHGGHTFLGKRVEKMRKELYLDVSYVSSKVGVAQSVYESFLEGRYRFDRDQLARLAETLGVTIHELFHERTHNPLKPEATRNARRKMQTIHVRPVRTNRKKLKSTPNENTQPLKSKKPVERAYDADMAAKQLAKKFKVKRG